MPIPRRSWRSWSPWLLCSNLIIWPPSERLRSRAPQLPQVACFDTSFHRTQPWVAEAFALPRRYTAEGARRDGFLGLSYEYIASVLPTLDAGGEFERTVVAHLGNGASMCALGSCKSIATTMGLSAIDGLPMGTRCGSIDPGVLLYFLSSGGLDQERLGPDAIS